MFLEQGWINNRRSQENEDSLVIIKKGKWIEQLTLKNESYKLHNSCIIAD